MTSTEAGFVIASLYGIIAFEINRHRENKMTQRTKAQRRYIRRGIRYEMIPLRPKGRGPRVSYLIGPHEDWRSQRSFARDILGMPIRPICKQFIHNGRKP